MSIIAAFGEKKMREDQEVKASLRYMTLCFKIKIKAKKDELVILVSVICRADIAALPHFRNSVLRHN